MRFLFVSVILVLLSGCGQKLYDWGGYNSSLYSYYDNPEYAEIFLATLEQHIGRLEAAGKVPAPGLYAELGTLYLEKGNTEQAIEMYKKERQAWPESQQLMASLINGLNQKQKQE